MIKHYMKVAFRNMWKYKGQTLVSVIGLAVGFACFAMATLWIRYEMTHDSFHRNADRIYCVYSHSFHSTTGATRDLPSPLAGYLKSTFPEIANLATVGKSGFNFTYQGVDHLASVICVDSALLGMFNIKIVEGNMDFLIPMYSESEKINYENGGHSISYRSFSDHEHPTNIAITREKALQIFGNESPIGKTLEARSGFGVYKICAVVTGLSKRSNYPFDFLRGCKKDIYWDMCSHYNILVELVRGIDMKTFEKKLYEHEIAQNTNIKNLKLVPITSIHYTDKLIKRNVQFQHIIIFAVAGFLLILCTLFNYLTLFLSRFRIRQRELALRTVYGASVRSLFTMLSVEFLLSLTVALMIGLVLIDILSSPFLTVSGTRLELSAIYLESTVYIAGIIAVALTIFVITLAFFKRRTLDSSIRSNKKLLRRASIIVQLIVSIVFAFCTLVILKQMYYLHNTDLGFSFKNRSAVYVSVSTGISGNYTEMLKIFGDKMRQIPEIKEVIVGYNPVFSTGLSSHISISDWDDKSGNIESVNIYTEEFLEDYAKFYDIELVAGEFPKEGEENKYVLINESAANLFGWNNEAVGKSFVLSEYTRYVVKGVVKNIYSFSPTVAARPFYYNVSQHGTTNCVSFRYDEGSLKTCMQKISKIIEKDFPDGKVYGYTHLEEQYDKYLKSENTLLVILTIVSLVCLIVCIFGFVSQVSLTCEERRKEIAIRKINGATVKDILDIFFKEYMSLLAAGALIAFPAGYLIMKRWLEQYVVQTEMSAWVYIAILFALIMVIIISVGGRVYRTSRENPVNALNK
jgi:ABC-type antimicrobial peptide transport system permease subunit